MCKLINLYAKVKLTIKCDWYWALVCPTNGRIYNTCYLFGGFFRVGLLIKMYILKARYLITIRNTSLTRQQILHRPYHTVGISLESELNQSGTRGGIHLTALFISISIQVFPRNPWKFTGSDDTLPARSSFCNSRELVSLHKNRWSQIDLFVTPDSMTYTNPIPKINYWSFIIINIMGDSDSRYFVTFTQAHARLYIDWQNTSYIALGELFDF